MNAITRGKGTSCYFRRQTNLCGAGIFFIGYSLFEVPSNLILARTGARLWIARIMITWGIIAAGMMFVRGPLSFYSLRFLLGIAEAGFFPGSEWFPSDARARAIARFMTAIPVSGMIGGPVSGALMGLSGRMGLAGWQWLFLLEGVPAVVLGVAVLRYLPDRPEGAAWLEPEQRRWLAERLAIERGRCVEHHGYSVARALSSGVVWQLGLLTFLSIGFGQYALGLWLPQIVRGFSGLSNLQVGFVSAIPNLVAVIAMVIVAAHSDHTGERCLHIAAASAAAAAGFLGCALVRSPAFAVMFEGMELREPAGCVLECVKPRKQHLRSDTDTARAAETGSRQTSAQTWATGKPRPALA